MFIDERALEGWQLSQLSLQHDLK